MVKDEPHSAEKLALGRERLIMVLTAADNIIERILHARQNKCEIDNWTRLPSAPGFGLSSQEQVSAMFRRVQVAADYFSILSTDMSGWDWTVQGFELAADAQVRAWLCGANPLLKRAMINRAYCLSKSVFVFSDGVMWAQTFSGMQKSGSYNTSSSNSRIRTIASRFVGSLWNIAMGDDCLEIAVPGALDLYPLLGKMVKNPVVCNLPGAPLIDLQFEFCSHMFKDVRNPQDLSSLADGGVSVPGAVPLTWAKTLYRLVHQKVSNEFERGAYLQQFLMEMRDSPPELLDRFREFFSGRGWGPENAIRETSSCSQAEDEVLEESL